MELYVLKTRRKGIVLTAPHMQMFMMSCYNTDRFRQFVFRSGFLTKFHVDTAEQTALREDDEHLLQFAFQWLKFALFQEPTLRINQPAS
jgi:hypothetical protein